MKPSLMNFGREDGQAVILVVVAMSVFMFGALGLALDVSQRYAQMQMAQVAADSAAQAGMMSILKGTNSTSANPFGTGSTPIASSACTTTDARTPCVYARLNGFGGTASDTVTLIYPATVSGVTLSSSVTVPAFAVSVRRTLPTGLIGFVGGAATYSFTITSRAGITDSPPTACFYTLNPNGTNTIDTSNGALTTTCGMNINGNLVHTGSGTINSAFIKYTGSYTGSHNENPVAAQTGTAVSDPFAARAAVAVPNTCDHTNFVSGSSSTTLSPGTYCGGITLSGSGAVTFQPGVYIVNGTGAAGKSLNITSGASVSGSNVTFYITGKNGYTAGPISVTGGGNLDLSAPSAGATKGLLFYQDRSVTYVGTNVFQGTSTATGTFYFPTTALKYAPGGNTVSPSALIAWTINYVDAGGGDITLDTTGQYTGLTATSVSLVQ